MKRYPILGRSVLVVGLSCIALSACVGSSAQAQTRLSVALGFENCTTPGCYAPATIDVENLAPSETARLQIVQAVGNEWRGEAEMRIELPQSIQSDGTYTSVIPVYDPANAVQFELWSSTGELLTEATLDLREGFRASPFPVYDRALPRFDDRAALVDVGRLPTDWWGYDSAESVWIASSLPDEGWATLAQWVLAGGSLVIVTGSDFYRMDTSALRGLLPIEDPYVAVSDSGTSYVSGTFAMQNVQLVAGDGFPLLIQTENGAGTVSLVTVRAGALTATELSQIAEHVPNAQLIRFDEITSSLLGAQRVATLNKPMLLLLMGLGIAMVAGVTVAGRRNPRWGWIGIGAGMAVITVLSGLMANPTDQLVGVYAYNTDVTLLTEVGIKVVSSSLYSRTDQSFRQTYPGDLIPNVSLPRTLTGADSYSAFAGSSSSQWLVMPGEVRDWHAYAAAIPLLHVHREDAATVRISNFHPTEFSDAWVIVDGYVHTLDSLIEGTRRYEIGSTGTRLARFLVESGDRPYRSAAQLLDNVGLLVALEDGVWLVASAVQERTAEDGVSQKVRDLTMVIARDGGGMYAY